MARDRGETEARNFSSFLGHFKGDLRNSWIYHIFEHSLCGETFPPIFRSFQGRCEDLADLCLEYIRNIPLYQYIYAYIIAKGLSAFKTCEPPKVRIVQSHFTRNARAITSRLFQVSHLQCLGDSKGEPKRWGLVLGVG